MLHPIKRKKGETEEARGARRLIMKLKVEGKGEGREHNNSSNPSEIILQQGFAVQSAAHQCLPFNPEYPAAPR